MAAVMQTAVGDVPATVMEQYVDQNFFDVMDKMDEDALRDLATKLKLDSSGQKYDLIGRLIVPFPHVDEETLASFKVDQLKDMCRANAIKTAGKKSVLVKKLIDQRKRLRDKSSAGGETGEMAEEEQDEQEPKLRRSSRGRKPRAQGKKSSGKRKAREHSEEESGDESPHETEASENPTVPILPATDQAAPAGEPPTSKRRKSADMAIAEQAVPSTGSSRGQKL